MYSWRVQNYRHFNELTNITGKTRQRFSGEIIPVGATQSFTEDENHGAGRAIDMDYSTQNNAVGKNGGKPWLKISLDQVYCVEKVVRRRQGDEIWQSWTCSDKNCKGTGQYAGDFYMTISSKEATPDRPSNSECSFGDTITYGSNSRKSVGARELVIIGRATIGGGKFTFIIVSTIAAYNIFPMKN